MWGGGIIIQGIIIQRAILNWALKQIYEFTIPCLFLADSKAHHGKVGVAGTDPLWVLTGAEARPGYGEASVLNRNVV